jgi:hypothetical protein
MSVFLDELNVRLAEAQKRLQTAQIEAQVAQGKLQAIIQEFNSLQFLVNSEKAKLQQQDNQPLSTSNIPANQSTVAQGELNKTDMIRSLLRQHPGGMTPTDIWKQVKDQMVHRAYLYSILKRLKDKDEVIVRRGKYITKMISKSTEGGNESVFLQ